MSPRDRAPPRLVLFASGCDLLLRLNICSHRKGVPLQGVERKYLFEMSVFCSVRTLSSLRCFGPVFVGSHHDHTAMRLFASSYTAILQWRLRGADRKVRFGSEAVNHSTPKSGLRGTGAWAASRGGRDRHRAVLTIPGLSAYPEPPGC